MAENIQRGLDDKGNPTLEVTDDHIDVPEKPTQPVERLAPVPESTVTVRGEGVGGSTVMTASEYKKYDAGCRAKQAKENEVAEAAEQEAAEIEAAEEAEAAEAAELIEMEAAEAAELAELEAAEAAEIAEKEAAEAAELAKLEADLDGDTTQISGEQ